MALRRGKRSRGSARQQSQASTRAQRGPSAAARPRRGSQAPARAQQVPQASGRMRQPRREGAPASGQAGGSAAHPARQRTARPGAASPSRSTQKGMRARSGAAAPRQAQEPEYTSTSVGELRRADREKRARKKARRHLARIVAIVVVVAGLVVGGVVLYQSPAFTIENVEVNGVEHLTSSEMSQLANVPPDSTLLRVDADAIANRLKQSAWVDEVSIDRAFPNTLRINVTERQVAAIVEIPVNGSKAVKSWAIAKDHVWLMPIPEAGSDAAKTTSAKIYEDADNALHIVDVPIGTKAEIGQQCVDGNVNNALDILAGMTTELSQRVVEVSAAGTAETTLLLDNGVEIAFGKAEDIRDKERVVLQILEENADNVSYINVRMVETPTWRAI